MGELKKWLETPVGWAKANMLYDLADGPPRPGSLQESVFLIIAKRRQEATFFQAKMMMEAILAPHVEGAGAIAAKSYEAFKDAMLPFLAGESKRASKKEKALLKHWTEKGAMRVRALWKPRDSSSMFSKLKRGAEKIKKQEEERRRKPHKRI